MDVPVAGELVTGPFKDQKPKPQFYIWRVGIRYPYDENTK